MGVEAVILDLDGTLLRSDKSISPRTAAVLSRAQDAGLALIVATARAPRAFVMDLVAEHFAESYCIFYNGAVIRNDARGYYCHFPLAPKTVSELLEMLADNAEGTSVTLESEGEWFSPPTLTRAEICALQQKYGEAPRCLSLHGIAQRQISKVLFHYRPEHLPIVEHLFGKASVLITDGGTLAQVSAIQATKEDAAARVLGHLHIDPARVMVFGDDYNDLGLFRLCGFPVAMGNAVPELKAIAWRVTLDNDDDGVALVIEDLLQSDLRLRRGELQND